MVNPMMMNGQMPYMNAGMVPNEKYIKDLYEALKKQEEIMKNY